MEEFGKRRFSSKWNIKIGQILKRLKLEFYTILSMKCDKKFIQLID